MKKHLALLAIGAAMISAPALANEADSQAKAQTFIEKADTDKNAQVSQAEFDTAAAQDPSAAPAADFSEADANSDGSLTLAELTVAKQKDESETGAPAQ